jgi:cytochrome c-type biogenesis protein CcmH
MMLWFVFALLLGGTVAALLWPLLRAPSQTPTRADYDLAVYRAQLAEMEADVERGLVAPDQAEAARLEIQRRMLAAAGAGSSAPSDDRRARTIAAIVIALMLPSGAGLLYAAYGSPRLPGQPYAGRLEHEPAVVLAAATDKLAAELVVHPNQSGYIRLAEMFVKQNDYADASESYRRAIKHGADNADIWSRLGETFVMASNGAVVPQALAAFARALDLDAREPRARFYAGLAEAQIGNLKAAVAIWRDLENDSTDSALLLLLHTEIGRMGKMGGFDPNAVPPSPPSAGALNAAVAAMTKAMRAQ